MATLFDGLTFSVPIDADRLTTQLGRVYRLMIDGQWRTLAEIANHVGGSEAGVSARLRDFRKEKIQAIYGTLTVERERVEQSGLWVYRLSQK